MHYKIMMVIRESLCRNHVDHSSQSRVVSFSYALPHCCVCFELHYEHIQTTFVVLWMHVHGDASFAIAQSYRIPIRVKVGLENDNFLFMQAWACAIHIYDICPGQTLVDSYQTLVVSKREAGVVVLHPHTEQYSVLLWVHP